MTNKMRPVEKTLRFGLSRIEEKKNWTQKAFAREKSGIVVDESSSEAVSFCAVGALCHKTRSHWAGDKETIASQLLLDNAVLFIPKEYTIKGKINGIVDVNDRINTELAHEGVLCCYALAIAMAHGANI